MAESWKHLDAIVNAIGTSRIRFKASPRDHVGGNMNLYYEEGDPSKKLAPDLYVVRGVAAAPEYSYKVWGMGKAPDLVLEVASPANAERDSDFKSAVCASMAVREYWRFDPRGELRGARRPGDRLQGSGLGYLGYAPLERLADGSIRSEALGLDVRVEGPLLRFRDPEPGEDLRTFEETEDDRRAAERARRAAEAENARLKAQIEALKARHAPDATSG